MSSAVDPAVEVHLRVHCAATAGLTFELNAKAVARFVDLGKPAVNLDETLTRRCSTGLLGSAFETAFKVIKDQLPLNQASNMA